MSSLRPLTRPHPTDPSQGDIVNATGMIEVARRCDTPQSRAFLAAYHEAEARIARESPFLSEGKIRDLAVMAAAKTRGVTLRTDWDGK